MSKTIPGSIIITFQYDTHIQKITGKKEEPAIISENMPFVLLLSILFQSYPEIEKKYPPGTLGFTVNGIPPQEYDIMQNGDTVSLKVFKI